MLGFETGQFDIAADDSRGSSWVMVMIMEEESRKLNNTDRRVESCRVN